MTTTIHTAARNIAAAATRNHITATVTTNQHKASKPAGPGPRLPASPRKRATAATRTRTEAETTTADGIGSRTSTEMTLRPSHPHDVPTETEIESMTAHGSGTKTATGRTAKNVAETGTGTETETETGTGTGTGIAAETKTETRQARRTAPTPTRSSAKPATANGSSRKRSAWQALPPWLDPREAVTRPSTTAPAAARADGPVAAARPGTARMTKNACGDWKRKGKGAAGAEPKSYIW